MCRHGRGSARPQADEHIPWAPGAAGIKSEIACTELAPGAPRGLGDPDSSGDPPHPASPRPHRHPCTPARWQPVWEKDGGRRWAVGVRPPAKAAGRWEEGPGAGAAPPGKRAARAQGPHGPPSGTKPGQRQSPPSSCGQSPREPGAGLPPQLPPELRPLGPSGRPAWSGHAARTGPGRGRAASTRSFLEDPTHSRPTTGRPAAAPHLCARCREAQWPLMARSSGRSCTQDSAGGGGSAFGVRGSVLPATGSEHAPELAS